MIRPSYAILFSTWKYDVVSVESVQNVVPHMTAVAPLERRSTTSKFIPSLETSGAGIKLSTSTVDERVSKTSGWSRHYGCIEPTHRTRSSLDRSLTNVVDSCGARTSQTSFEINSSGVNSYVYFN